MLKKTIKFEDFNGDMQEEDHYFNISKSEIVELELSIPGKETFSDYLTRIISSEDNLEIANTFRKIIKTAYGVKSPDGKRFHKTEQIWEDFVSSAAYQELFIQLCMDADFAAEFVRGILPKDLVDIEDKNDRPVEKFQSLTSLPKELNAKDLREMTVEQFQEWQKNSEQK